jgi:hypothetical protein
MVGRVVELKNLCIQGCTTRDAATYEMLEATRAKNEQPFRKRLREQLNGLNKNAGRNLTVLVPVWDAVLSSEFKHPIIAEDVINKHFPQCERVSPLV